MAVYASCRILVMLLVCATLLLLSAGAESDIAPAAHWVHMIEYADGDCNDVLSYVSARDGCFKSPSTPGSVKVDCSLDMAWMCSDDACMENCAEHASFDTKYKTCSRVTAGGATRYMRMTCNSRSSVPTRSAHAQVWTYTTPTNAVAASLVQAPESRLCDPVHSVALNVYGYSETKCSLLESSSAAGAPVSYGKLTCDPIENRVGRWLCGDDDTCTNCTYSGATSACIGGTKTVCSETTAPPADAATTLSESIITICIVVGLILITCGAP